MRRLLYLTVLSMLAALMFAPTARAAVHLCGDHPNQQSAQAALDQDPSLAPNLDANGNGIACDEVFGGGETTMVAPTTMAAPAAPAPSQAPLPDTGGPQLLLLVAVLLLGSGMLGLAVLRRVT